MMPRSLWPIVYNFLLRIAGTLGWLAMQASEWRQQLEWRWGWNRFFGVR
jgi:hypothetical protein